jgi:hypothetical protein
MDTAEMPIMHGASIIFMTGNPPANPGDVGVIDICVLKCACGFEARSKCWRDAGSILDNHLWQKLRSNDTVPPK